MRREKAETDKLLNELGISIALGKLNMADLVKWLIFARLNEQGSRLSSVRLADRHDPSVFGLKNLMKNLVKILAVFFIHCVSN